MSASRFVTSFFFASTYCAVLMGDILPSSTMSSTTKSSSAIEGFTHLEPKSTPSNSEKSSPSVNYIPIIPSDLTEKKATYLHPGILVNFNGVWEGSDHLFNLSNHIGVNITFIKNEEVKFELTSDQLKKEVEAIFRNASIDPQILVGGNAPPLPVFEIEIFLYALDKGYLASCQGRLFESVLPIRFKLESNMAFQAITWEKQSLIVGPKDGFTNQLKQEVIDISRAFAEKFTIFERLKSSVK